MHIQFAELPVVDQDRAKRFYVETLGCEVASDVAMGQDGWRWIELRFANARTALHFIRRQPSVSEDVPVLALVAEDVMATVEALRAKGVEIVTEPHNPLWRPGRTVAAFRDSEGNHMMLGSL